MRIKFLFRIVVLQILATTVGCSQAATPSLEKKEPAMLNQTVSGSYIVKVSGDGEQVIRRVFAQYGVVLVRPLGNDQFELRLSRNPGLDTLKSMAARSDGAVTAVQPNFVYHSD
jgi:hypothetical protein